MASTLKLDHRGLAAVLKSQGVKMEVHQAAEKIAAEVRASATVERHGIGGDVVVRDYETDRAASSVTVEHPAGLAMQAKYGILTRSAGGR